LGDREIQEEGVERSQKSALRRSEEPSRGVRLLENGRGGMHRSLSGRGGERKVYNRHDLARGGDCVIVQGGETSRQKGVNVAFAEKSPTQRERLLQ